MAVEKVWKQLKEETGAVNAAGMYAVTALIKFN